jgi:glucose/arabinose dehydrogenase
VIGALELRRGGAFVGEHGSWDRDKDEAARGRPLGVALDNAGALLIAADVGNTVWRVTRATQTAALK